MKKKSFLYGILGLLTLGLSSCSSDAPEMVGNGSAKADEVRYLRIAISNPPASRAVEFVNGTAAENLVKNLVFKFYDAAGNPIAGDNITILDAAGETVITPNTEVPFDGVGGNENPTNVGALKTVIAQIGLSRGENYPAYVACFINPQSYGDLNKLTMAELRGEKRDGYLSTDNCFSMSNSVYYGADAVTGAQQVRIFATPIASGSLKTSLAAAKDVTGTDVVNIYVERYAAKVNLTLDQTKIEPLTVGDYVLTFVPEKWTINANETKTYVAKRFEDNDATTDVIPTYSAVQTMLGNWTSWNDPTNFRSYWGCSPSYYSSQFPQVSDNLIDNAGSGAAAAGVAVAPYDLCYYSYNNINGTSGLGAGVSFPAADAENQTTSKYTLENTMNSLAFNSVNPRAAAPSVLIVGQYNITYNGTAVTPTQGFCIYNSTVYFRNSVPADAPAGAKTIMNALLDANAILAVDVDGTLLTSANAGAYSNYFEVTHPNKEVRGVQALPHRYVTLQLKSDLAEVNNLYYKPAGSSTWTAVTAADINKINVLLWQQLGNASAYTNSKCYFSIPIQHLGMFENTTNSPYTDGVLDWSKVRVGDFGLVRNHVYNIQVNGITGRATGIESLENPLVPSMDSNDYWIKYQINILNWRLVPTQQVVL